MKIGSGTCTSFWKDCWIDNHPPLSELFPRLYQLSLHQESVVSDMDVWNGNELEWMIRWRRRMFQWENQQFSNLMCLIDRYKPQQNAIDKPRWKASNDGQFIVKAFVDHSSS